MKHIAFITLGNIEKIATMKRAIGLANPLFSLGWQVSIIALDCEANRNRLDLDCENDINVYYYINSNNILDEVRQKSSLINEINPDVVYFCSFGFRNLILKNKLSSKIKYIVEHSELTSCITGASCIKRFSYLFIELYSIYYSDMILCASRYLESHYCRLNRIFFSNSKNVGYFPYAYSENIKPKEDAIKFDTINLVYLGSLVKNYGLYTMLEAAKEIASKHRNFKFTLIGKGDIEYAKKFVVQNGIEEFVEFLGYIPEISLNNYLNKADILLSPLNDTIQDWARCPSKLYTYLPYKKPVFTCKIGEAFEIFGESGYYFDNNNPKSLANLVENFFKNPLPPVILDIEVHSWNTRALQLNNFITNLK